MTTADPATLVGLMQLYHAHAAELTDDLRRGGFFLKHAVPVDAWAAVESAMGPLPRRADELARIGVPARIADLWPGLRMVVTWTGDRGSEAAAALARHLARQTCVFEFGHVASEFRGTLTLGRRPGTGFPTIDTHFFEFVERERWDRGDVDFLTIDQLRKGGDYYVLVTTPSGLYRYFVDEIVRVTGRLHATPLLRFLGNAVAKPGSAVTGVVGAVSP